MENNPNLNQEQNNQLAPIVQLANLNHVQVADTIINAVKEGDVDPMQIHMFLKRVEKLSETVLKDEDVKEITLNSAQNHITKGSSFDYMGAKLTVMAVHTSYDFSACGDPVYDNLSEIKKRVDEAIKEREKYLKAAFPDNTSSLYGSANPKIVVDKLWTLTEADCGEEITLMRPIKYQKTGIKTTFPK